MKWIAATVTFSAPDRGLATDLVADIFYSLDLKGVVIDDPEMDPTQDWGDNALPPPQQPIHVQRYGLPEWHDWLRHLI